MGKYAVRAVGALCASLLLMACAAEDTAKEQAEQSEDWMTERTKQDRRTSQDRRTKPQDAEKVKRISLNDHDGRMILTESGDIWLSGSLDGQVVIDAQEDELVHLYLAGVEISSMNGPAICIQEAAKVIVTLVPDTENVLSDSPDYKDCGETPACFYSVCDLTINGSGMLHVFGYYEDGIRGKDRIRLLDGTFSVHAKGDGIRGNDGIYMRDAFVEVESEKNGLRTVNQGADDRGVIEVGGGSLSVVAGKTGICAASDLYLYECLCSVKAVEERVRTEGTAYIADGVQRL